MLAGSAPPPPSSSPAFAAAVINSPATSNGGGGGSISVITTNTNGGEIWGLYTTLWQNGSPVQSCYSPCAFSVSGGQSYSVSVDNWESYTFTQWGNGVQSRLYPISEPGVPTSLTLWAVYS
jgi:hypothetical protein